MVSAVLRFIQQTGPFVGFLTQRRENTGSKSRICPAVTYCNRTSVRSVAFLDGGKLRTARFRLKVNNAPLFVVIASLHPRSRCLGQLIRLSPRLMKIEAEKTSRLTSRSLGSDHSSQSSEPAPVWLMTEIVRLQSRHSFHE